MPRRTPNELPAIAILNALLEYRDGKLFSRVNRKTLKTGHEAGCEQRNGYRRIKVNGKAYSTHRIIFHMAHGYCPDILDHIDGNPSNNLIENLRAATMSENKCNQKLYSSNTSGVKGVYWCIPKGAWIAQIGINHRRRTLGRFYNKDDAARCVAQARETLHKEYTNYGT